MTYLNTLNDEQQEAVRFTNGPLLVLAGAGTGKTRVLVNRIAHLINMQYAQPDEIIALTFSNKAANEMRSRINNVLTTHANDNEPVSADKVWVGTFHAVATRILQQNVHNLKILAGWNHSSNFKILNEYQSLRIIKKIIERTSICGFSEKIAYEIISTLKDKLYKPDNIPESEATRFPGIRSIYSEYQRYLSQSGCMDFADLLMYCIELLNKNKELCHYYQSKFKYILVDEYQDTSFAQYAIIRLLAQKHCNVCCVGDDDQAIYGWRGALIENILQFNRHFPNAKIINLKLNYRSTLSIIDSANRLISNNKLRHSKELLSVKKETEKINLHVFKNERDEVYKITQIILEKLKKIQKNRPNTAILVRASHQMHIFEDVFNLSKIQYKIVGGVRFYDRTEIQDILCYLRIVQNENDNEAFERIINTPKRNIGETTVQLIKEKANNSHITLMQAAREVCQKYYTQISKLTLQNLQAFLHQILRWQKLLKAGISPTEITHAILNDTEYMEYLQKSSSSFNNQAFEKSENIKELISYMSDFKTLNEYLIYVENMKNNNEDETYDATFENSDIIKIMTIHAAKGLEFDTVFLPGWEEGIFPNKKSLDEKQINGLEEERRLAYVAITRAKKELHISHALERRIFGSHDSTVPSRFIKELDSKHCILHNHVLKR